MSWYGGRWPFWEVGLMWTGMVAFWVLIGWAIYAFVKSVWAACRHAVRLSLQGSHTVGYRGGATYSSGRRNRGALQGS